MFQRRRTEIRANNATIRRHQMKPYSNRFGSSRGSNKDSKRFYHSSKFILVILGLFLSFLHYHHDGGDVNDRKILPVPVPAEKAKQNDMLQTDYNHDKADIAANEEPKHESVKETIYDDTDKGEYVVKSELSDTDTATKDEEHLTVANHEDTSLSRYGDWRTMIKSVREEFYHRYGGEIEAMNMLNRGVITAADTEAHAVKHTSERIVRAFLKGKENGKGNFVMSFGGYSVTVGRGNYYHQSYPFIMQNILKPIFEKSLNMDLIVRNSAIGGIPSFPYGWCLPNFLGDDSDVISWDYGMNEGNGAEAFEAYLRQGVSNLSKRPMMIMLDNKKPRINLLKAYYKNGVLTDSIAVGRGEVVSKDLLGKDEKDRPIGLQNWDKWGAPPGSPGQSSWHPKYMEHELIGWMIAMHFLDAIEGALTMLESVENDDSIDLGINDEDHEQLVLLPEPVTGVPKGIPEAAVTHILYGTKLDKTSENVDQARLWHMDRVSCRSNFLPNINGHMSEIIMSGTAQDIGDDLMDKTDEQYNSGWVIDVGKVERETKRKVQKVGNGEGLGYIDMKLALYGIPESGSLVLSLPHDGPVHDHDHEHDSDMKAPHWFDALVFCEVNEKRGAKECKTEEDLTFIVGGVKSPAVTKITSAASYLKKAICVNVEIPKDAVVKISNHPDSENVDSLEMHDKVELSVEVSVTGKHVNRNDGACSISHVVWQSH